MAEVKVKVTAQNETRTGFQQALNDAKQFGNEATRSVTIDDEAALAPLRKIQQQLRDVQAEARRPISAGEIASAGGGGGAELTASESRRAATAIRGLASDLSTASTPAQAFEAILTRVAQAAGRLTSVVVGFAVGKIIAGQIDKLNVAFSQAIASATAFQRAITTAGRATDLSSALAQFNQLNSIADQTGQTLKTLQKDLGASFANFALGGVPFRELAALEEAQRRAAGANLVNNTQFLLDQAGGRLGVAGDSSAEQEFERKAKQAAELFALEQQLQNIKSRGDGQLSEADKELVRNLRTAIDLTKQRFEIEDQIAEKRKEAAAAAEAMAARQQAAGTSRAIADFGVDPATLLARAQERLSALENPNIAANMGLTPEQAAAERKRIMLEILGLEQQVTSEIEKQKADRERAAKSLADAIEDREFAGMSPDEQRAKIAADQAALISGLESGEISPAEAAQRALELARREDGLATTGGVTGGVEASALQRVGLASNEFIDTRSKDPTAEEVKTANRFLEKMLNVLQNSDGLYLSSN
jgi:hypothetical protein